MENQKQNLLNLLARCAEACNNCSAACLEEENVKMMAACIKLDMDCAQICALTAAFISRGSPHATHLMKECAEICTACANECEKHQYDHCRLCAEMCRKCAEACKSEVH